VRYSKQLIHDAAEVSEEEGWRINDEAMRVIFSSADAMEARSPSPRSARPTGRVGDRSGGPAARPTLDAIRLFLHVAGATVWVGGMFVMMGLQPTPAPSARSPQVPRRAFSRLAWPAFALLIITGF